MPPKSGRRGANWKSRLLLQTVENEVDSHQDRMEDSNMNQGKNHPGPTRLSLR